MDKTEQFSLYFNKKAIDENIDKSNFYKNFKLQFYGSLPKTLGPQRIISRICNEIKIHNGPKKQHMSHFGDCDRGANKYNFYQFNWTLGN